MIPIKDHNPTLRRPIVTLVLIVICALVYLWQLGLGEPGYEASIRALGLTPAVLFGSARLPMALDWVPVPATLLTSMFLHGGFMHLAGNMLFLWIFGDNIEDNLGPVPFVLFYLFCGLVAALAQALPNMQSPIPMIGASGAVSGVLGAYMVRYPRAPVTVLIPFLAFFTVRVPALLVLGLWFGGQLLSSTLAHSGAGVAFRAHVGGFVAGAAIFLLTGKNRQIVRR